MGIAEKPWTGKVTNGGAAPGVDSAHYLTLGIVVAPTCVDIDRRPEHTLGIHRKRELCEYLTLPTFHVVLSEYGSELPSEDYCATPRIFFLREIVSTADSKPFKFDCRLSKVVQSLWKGPAE